MAVGTTAHRSSEGGSPVVIEVVGLSKSYGGVVGVQDVTFSVPRGEVFGFLGPNGAGKTTTIRLLMQLLRPDRGRLELFGMSLDERHPELHDRIGYLPGEFRPPPEMSAHRFLEYMARYRRRSPRLRSELCERLGFTERDRQKRIRHLSHGNRQKLGLLLALEHEPDLAILDEPTIGLDPLVQDAFYGILRDLTSRGTTVFLSSHLLAEVEKVCNRVAIIRGGKLVAEESIEVLRGRRPRRLVAILHSEDGAAPDLPGTKLVSQHGARCTYLVHGDVRSVVAATGAVPVTEFYLPEPDLEDVFMAFYEGGHP